MDREFVRRYPVLDADAKERIARTLKRLRAACGLRPMDEPYPGQEPETVDALLDSLDNRQGYDNTHYQALEREPTMPSSALPQTRQSFVVVFVFVVAALFAYGVWPTPWRVYVAHVPNGEGTAPLSVREHRFTGRLELMRAREGWEPFTPY